MPDVGDRVRMHATKVDQAPREGVVTGVNGSLLRVKWSTGEETTMVPGPGSVAVIGKVRKAPGKEAKAAGKATKKTTKATKKSAR
jgi:uncharacterized protein DUF1918